MQTGVIDVRRCVTMTSVLPIVDELSKVRGLTSNKIWFSILLHHFESDEGRGAM